MDPHISRPRLDDMPGALLSNCFGRKKHPFGVVTVQIYAFILNNKEKM